MTQHESTTPDSTISDYSQLPLTYFYDEAEINGTAADDTLNSSDQAAPGSTFVDLSELFNELDFQTGDSSSSEPEDSIDLGILFAEDLPVSSVLAAEDKIRMSCYAKLEDSVVIPDF